MAGSPAVAGEAGMAPMAPPAMTSPEEDMANQIVPQAQPQMQPGPGAASSPEGEEELDENGQPVKKKKPPFPPKQ